MMNSMTLVNKEDIFYQIYTFYWIYKLNQVSALNCSELRSSIQKTLGKSSKDAVQTITSHVYGFTDSSFLFYSNIIYMQTKGLAEQQLLEAEEGNNPERLEERGR